MRSRERLNLLCLRKKMDTEHNYFGICFWKDFLPWEDFCRLCIAEPDDAFEMGEFLIALWREEESATHPRAKPCFGTILTAMCCNAAMYLQCLSLVYLHQNETNFSFSPLNLRAWKFSNKWNFYDFKIFHSMEELLHELEGRSECTGKGNEAVRTFHSLTVPENLIAQAADRWEREIYDRLDVLFHQMADAKSFLLLRPILNEWLHYSWQISIRYPEKHFQLAAQWEKFCFMPWYGAALQKIDPPCHEIGLCVVRLPSIQRFAVYDYCPERNRRFVFELQGNEVSWGYERPEGLLVIAKEASGEDVLPLDKAKHLHLLPLSLPPGHSVIHPSSYEGFPSLYLPSRNEEEKNFLQSSVHYDESWLGMDYHWE